LFSISRLNFLSLNFFPSTLLFANIKLP